MGASRQSIQAVPKGECISTGYQLNQEIEMGKLDGIIETLIGFGIIIGLCVWGIFALYDHFFVFDGIKSEVPIKPRIELVLKDNKVDTLYVYELN